jgi:hypothetical protein
MKNPPLPEKIYIKPLCEYLGLSNMAQDAQLDVLKSHSKDSGLLFTFDEALRGIPVDIPLSEIYDETDEFKPAKREYIQCIFKRKSFTLKNYSIDYKGKASTCIRQFELSGVGFNIVNKEKSNFGSYDVDLAKVYVKKLDFNNAFNVSGDNVLKTTTQNLDHSIQKNVKPVNKAENPQDKRFGKFTEYCKQRAKDKQLPDEEHQTIYDSFTPPLTKEDFYNELSKYDIKVFNGNLSDFFRDDRIKIKLSKAARKK